MTDYERVERDYAGVEAGVIGDKQVNAILAERKKQYHPHGDYIDVARVSQDLKRILTINTRVKLHDDQAESLDMICNKLARIVIGNPDLIDSWDDIAGYAKLVANRLRG